MTGPRLVMAAVLAAGVITAALTPAQAEFFGCNTPKVTHYSTSGSSWSYRAGSRYGHHAYASASRRFAQPGYRIVRHVYRSHW